MHIRAIKLLDPTKPDTAQILSIIYKIEEYFIVGQNIQQNNLSVSIGISLNLE